MANETVDVTERDAEQHEPCDVKFCSDPGVHPHAYKLCDRHQAVLYPAASKADETCKHGRHLGGYYCEDCEDERRAGAQRDDAESDG